MQDGVKLGYILGTFLLFMFSLDIYLLNFSFLKKQKKTLNVPQLLLYLFYALYGATVGRKVLFFTLTAVSPSCKWNLKDSCSFAVLFSWWQCWEGCCFFFFFFKSASHSRYSIHSDFHPRVLFCIYCEVHVTVGKRNVNCKAKLWIITHYCRNRGVLHMWENGGGGSKENGKNKIKHFDFFHFFFFLTLLFLCKLSTFIMGLTFVPCLWVPRKLSFGLLALLKHYQIGKSCLYDNNLLYGNKIITLWCCCSKIRGCDEVKCRNSYQSCIKRS